MTWWYFFSEYVRYGHTLIRFLVKYQHKWIINILQINMVTKIIGVTKQLPKRKNEIISLWNHKLLCIVSEITIYIGPPRNLVNVTKRKIVNRISREYLTSCIWHMMRYSGVNYVKKATLSYINGIYIRKFINGIYIR